MADSKLDNNSIESLLGEMDNSPQTQSVNFDAYRLILSLKKSAILGIIALLITTASAYLYVKYTKPRFQSNSTLKLDVQSSAGELGFNTGSDVYNDNLAGEIELIRSNIIKQSVIDTLNLYVTYHLNGKILDEERYRNSPIILIYDDPINHQRTDQSYGFDLINENNFELFLIQNSNRIELGKYQFEEPIRVEGIKFSIKKGKEFSNHFINRSFTIKTHSVETLQNYIELNLTVSILNHQARTLKVMFEDETPLKAHDIVAAIDHFYLTTTLNKKKLANQKMIDFIDNQIDSTQKQLYSAETDLENYFKRMKTNDPNGEFTRILTKFSSMNENLIKLKLKDKMLSDVALLIAENKYQENYYHISEEGPSNQLSRLLSSLNVAIKNFEDIKSANKPNTIAYKARENEVKKLQSSVFNVITTDQLETTKLILKSEDDILALEAKFNDLPSKETELNRLKRYYQLYERFYLTLKDKRVSYGITMAGTVPQFVVLSQPALPAAPVSPQKSLIYVGGAASGVVIFLLIIALNFFLDDTILSQRDIERTLKAPILGVVPRYNDEGMDVSRLVIHEHPKAAISEAIRAIRTNLDFMKGKADETLMLSVTSTISGEGKTFVAINLGGILALNKKVVLIDLDMRKPKVHRAFDVDNEKGMSTLLIKKSTLANTVRHTEIPGFDYITAGPTPPNPSELIMREEFMNLISELKNEYDVIMIDTPPIGLVTDAMIVMKLVDIPMYVVRMGYSKKGIENGINNYYNKEGLENLSVILNSVDVNSSYGGYGYGYGYYEDEIPTTKKRFFFF
jgi:capsular exopolysaccharide synthesis family protein